MTFGAEISWQDWAEYRGALKGLLAEICSDPTELQSLIKEVHELSNKPNKSNSHLDFCKKSKTSDPISLALESLPLLTFAQYMHEMMFDPNEGYYSSGKVNFDGITPDFVTNATSGKALALINLVDMLQQWLNAGQPSTFFNYEGGGGNGALAYDTLLFASMLAERKSLPDEDAQIWKNFYEALRYFIVELSPALVKRQTEKCKTFIKSGKLTILNEDIVCFKPPTERIHRMILQELIDDLPLEGFTKNDKNGRILTLTKLETIPYAELVKHNSKIDSVKLDLAALKQSSDAYRRQLGAVVDISGVPEEYCIISKNDFKKLPKVLRAARRFFDLFFPVQYFSGPCTVLHENSHLISQIEPGEILYVRTHLNKLVENLGRLSDRCAIFDYGAANEKDIAKGIRLYGANSLEDIQPVTTKSNNSVPPWPNHLNITHDVNFSEVASKFEEALFKTQVFGHQSIILNQVNLPLFQSVIDFLIKIEEEKIADVAKLTFETNIVLHLQRFIYMGQRFKVMVLEKQPNPPVRDGTYYPSSPDLRYNAQLIGRYDAFWAVAAKREESQKKLVMDDMDELLQKSPKLSR